MNFIKYLWLNIKYSFCIINNSIKNNLNARSTLISLKILGIILDRLDET